jgi:hypothetical protein
MADEREYDEAIEALRRAFCALPRWSFHLDSRGNVRRVEDRSGNWVEFSQVHELFDAEMVDAALAKMRTAEAVKKAKG